MKTRSAAILSSCGRWRQPCPPDRRSTPKNSVDHDVGEAPGIAGFSIDFERHAEIAHSPRLVAPALVPRLTNESDPKGRTLMGWINDANGAIR
jgi:hypothetical protein